MHISIRHRTVYSYGEEATYSVQRLRLTPAPHDGVKIIDWRIDAPGIDKALVYTDGFENRVHVITCIGPHREVVIDVTGEVETFDKAGLVTGLPETVPLSIYLRPTPLTRPDKGIAALAAKSQGKDDVSRLHNLMALIRDAVTYELGTTHSATTAAEALQRGAGVCQDHTHIFVSAARCLGFPARYTAGYLWATEGEPQEAQHAWAEVHVPHLGWTGFDVSNGISPDPHYVRVASGLDYTYAAPVKGMRRGGGAESMDVHVEVGAPQSQQ
ncbi:MAG: transglutaminase family protein [Pseudomonadota bacterium]|nr:transglutaminase family protein [Pseudomonadota bacterium]